MFQMFHFFFCIYVNYQKSMTSNKTCLTIYIADIIISEGLSFNLAQKPTFEKILELARNVSKPYIPPNRNLIYKDLLGVIHKQNMKSNLEMIKKKEQIFGLLFLWDRSTIPRCPLLNILTSWGKHTSCFFGNNLL